MKSSLAEETFKEMMPKLVSTHVPADGLAPKGARPSASTVMVLKIHGTSASRFNTSLANRTNLSTRQLVGFYGAR